MLRLDDELVKHGVLHPDRDDVAIEARRRKCADVTERVLIGERRKERLSSAHRESGDRGVPLAGQRRIVLIDVRFEHFDDLFACLVIDLAHLFGQHRRCDFVLIDDAVDPDDDHLGRALEQLRVANDLRRGTQIEPSAFVAHQTVEQIEHRISLALSHVDRQEHRRVLFAAGDLGIVFYLLHRAVFNAFGAIAIVIRLHRLDRFGGGRLLAPVAALICILIVVGVLFAVRVLFAGRRLSADIRLSAARRSLGDILVLYAPERRHKDKHQNEDDGQSKSLHDFHLCSQSITRMRTSSISKTFHR